jgi:hypothetical protein
VLLASCFCYCGVAFSKCYNLRQEEAAQAGSASQFTRLLQRLNQQNANSWLEKVGVTVLDTSHKVPLLMGVGSMKGMDRDVGRRA